MSCLNEHQTRIIAQDVEQAGISYSHLSADLTDHICCDVEFRMQQGLPFEVAYAKIKEDFGFTGLQEIQQNTLMLIDQNYRIMKKSMKTMGSISLAVITTGVLLKILHLHTANIVLGLGFIGLIFLFFPAMLYVMYKEVNNRTKLSIYITALLGGTLFFASIFFKVLHWPLANIMLMGGLLIISLLLIPQILIQGFRQTSLNKGLYTGGLILLSVFILGVLFKTMHWPGAAILLIASGFLLVSVVAPAFYFLHIKPNFQPNVATYFGIMALTFFLVLSLLLRFSSSNPTCQDSNSQTQIEHQTVR